MALDASSCWSSSLSSEHPVDNDSDGDNDNRSEVPYCVPGTEFSNRWKPHIHPSSCRNHPSLYSTRVPYPGQLTNWAGSSGRNASALDRSLNSINRITYKLVKEEHTCYLEVAFLFSHPKMHFRTWYSRKLDSGTSHFLSVLPKYRYLCYLDAACARPPWRAFLAFTSDFLAWLDCAAIQTLEK